MFATAGSRGRRPRRPETRPLVRTLLRRLPVTVTTGPGSPGGGTRSSDARGARCHRLDSSDAMRFRNAWRERYRIACPNRASTRPSRRRRPDRPPLRPTRRPPHPGRLRDRPGPPSSPGSGKRSPPPPVIDSTRCPMAGMVRRRAVDVDGRAVVDCWRTGVGDSPRPKPVTTGRRPTTMDLRARLDSSPDPAPTIGTIGHRRPMVIHGRSRLRPEADAFPVRAPRSSRRRRIGSRSAGDARRTPEGPARPMAPTRPRRSIHDSEADSSPRRFTNSSVTRIGDSCPIHRSHHAGATRLMAMVPGLELQERPGSRAWDQPVRCCNAAGRIMRRGVAGRSDRSGSSTSGLDRSGRRCMVAVPLPPLIMMTATVTATVTATAMAAAAVTSTWSTPRSRLDPFTSPPRGIRRSDAGASSRRCGHRRSMRWSSTDGISRCSTRDDFRSRWRPGPTRGARRSPSSCCGRGPSGDAARRRRPDGWSSLIPMAARSTARRRGAGGWIGSGCRRPRRSVVAAIRPDS